MPFSPARSTLSGLALLSLLAATACHPRVSLSYIQPASVTLPPEVTTVAVVNRAGGDLGVEATQTLSTTLVRSPRLKAVDPAAGQAALASGGGSVVGMTLDPALAAKICQATHATGVVSLESLDDGGGWQVSTRQDDVTETNSVKDCDTCKPHDVTVTHKVTVYEATWVGTVSASWSLQDGAGRILDRTQTTYSDSLYGEGPSEGDAKSAAGDPHDLRDGLAAGVGASYAAHIAPMPVNASRTYYKGHGADMKAGHTAAQGGHWEAAAKAWSKAAKASEGKKKGKAQLDLALANEAQNKLPDAATWVRRARKNLGDKKLVLAYQDILRTRAGEAKTLEEQMPGAAPTP